MGSWEGRKGTKNQYYHKSIIIDGKRKHVYYGNGLEAALEYERDLAAKPKKAELPQDFAAIATAVRAMSHIVRVESEAYAVLHGAHFHHRELRLPERNLMEDPSMPTEPQAQAPETGEKSVDAALCQAKAQGSPEAHAKAREEAGRYFKKHPDGILTTGNLTGRLIGETSRMLQDLIDEPVDQEIAHYRKELEFDSRPPREQNLCDVVVLFRLLRHFSMEKMFKAQSAAEATLWRRQSEFACEEERLYSRELDRQKRLRQALEKKAKQLA